MMPKLSVIVPVFNAYDTLRRCVDSILNQTYGNLELILVNDGSVDGSGELCDSLKEQDERIIVIHKENEGVSSSRNAGLERASGELIGFVDADDWICSEMYTTLFRHLLENKAELAVCGYQVESDNGIVRRSFPKDIVAVFNSTTMIINAITLKYQDSSSCAKVWKADALRDLRFDEGMHYAEDLLFLVSSLLNIRRTVYTSQPLYHYYERVGSATRSSEVSTKKMNSLVVFSHLVKMLGKQYPGIVPQIYARCMKYCMLLLIQLAGSQQTNRLVLVAQVQRHLRASFTAKSYCCVKSWKTRMGILLALVNSRWFCVFSNGIQVILRR